MSIQDPDPQSPERGSGMPFFLVGMALALAPVFGVGMGVAFGPVLAVAMLAGSAIFIYLGVQRSFGSGSEGPQELDDEPRAGPPP